MVRECYQIEPQRRSAIHDRRGRGFEIPAGTEAGMEVAVGAVRGHPDLPVGIERRRYLGSHPELVLLGTKDGERLRPRGVYHVVGNGT